MLVSSLTMLGVATVANYLSLNFKDDVVRAAMALTGILFVIFALTIAPLPLQIMLVIAILLAFEPLNNWLCKRY